MDIFQLFRPAAKDWTHGTANLDGFMSRMFDHARFHRGSGFRVNVHPPVPLNEALDAVRGLLKHGKGGVVTLTSVKDGWQAKSRSIERADPTRGDLVIGNAAELKGTPYVFGVTDCSWLSEASYRPETGEDWPHNAHLQHLMFQGQKTGYVQITRDKIRPGDLLFFHGDAHVAIYAGRPSGFSNIESVWDTEPHDTVAPAGWPSTMLGTGVRVRPMIGNYYCAWQYVNGVGRVVDINGKP